MIHALARGHKRHVPYRNSTLTRLLQDCLGDNGKTNFVVRTLHLYYHAYIINGIPSLLTKERFYAWLQSVALIFFPTENWTERRKSNAQHTRVLRTQGSQLTIPLALFRFIRLQHTTGYASQTYDKTEYYDLLQSLPGTGNVNLYRRERLVREVSLCFAKNVSDPRIKIYIAFSFTSWLLIHKETLVLVRPQWKGLNVIQKCWIKLYPSGRGRKKDANQTLFNTIQQGWPNTFTTWIHVEQYWMELLNQLHLKTDTENDDH